MKTIITIILTFLIFLTTVFGQESRNMEWKDISSKDSINLDIFWTKFTAAIDKKDTSTIRSLSLSKIDCDLCITIDSDNYSPPEDYIIPVDTFLVTNIYDIVQSQLWKSLKTRGYRPSIRVIYDYQRRNLPKDYGKNIEIYELWIQTYLPNEWTEGHEGQSHAFQFIKYKNEFKFYGITSIP